MRPEELESELLLYWIQYHELENKGGPVEDGDLFEEILAREEAILEHFGLPPAQKYTKVLWHLANKETCSPASVKKTLTKLDKLAMQYHTAKVVPSLEMLKTAREKKAHSADILPELGFSTHIYTIFLYEDLLLTGKNSPEEILKELETLHKADLYSPVATLKFNLKPTYRRTKAYKDLSAQLQFLDLFLQESSDFSDTRKPETPGRPESSGERFSEAEGLDWIVLWKPEAPTNQEKLPGSEAYQPEFRLLLGCFEIEEIIYDEESAVTLVGRYHESQSPVALSLGLEFEELYNLLQHPGYRSQPAISNLLQKGQAQLFNEPTIIDLINITGKTFFLDQHYFRVYKPRELNRDGQAEEKTDEFYLVDDIRDKATYDAHQKQNLKNGLNGRLNLIRKWYNSYLKELTNGASDAVARKRNNLENHHLFELARMLYQLKQHGGDPEIKNQH